MLSFEQKRSIIKSFGLREYTLQDKGERFEYALDNSKLERKVVVTNLRSNGNGYIYVGYLKKYKDLQSKKGHMSIKSMSEAQLREIILEVINCYMGREKSNLESNAIFSSNNKHRYFLERLWNKSKPMVTIIMLNPSYADELKWDYSSMRCINFLIKDCKNIDCGGVDIINLFSYIQTESKKLPQYKERYDKNTDIYIEKVISQNKVFIIGWGSNKNKQNRINKVKVLLKKYNIKDIYRFTDSEEHYWHISILKKPIKLKKISIDKI